MNPKSERRSKRKADPVSSATPTPAKNGNGKSIWDDNFPFGDFIDNHFITEKDREEYEKWGLEKCFHVLQATPIQLVSIGRFMEQKVGDLENKNKAYVEESTELKMKLSESEKNVDKLKKHLEELSLEKSRLMVKEEELAEENSKIKIKLLVKDDIIDKMKSVIEDLKAEIEEVKAEIPAQHNAGFDNAVKQILVSISELKP